jgi:tripartite-type tricarboxylate transporter receptor subunit TctC
MPVRVTISRGAAVSTAMLGLALAAPAQPAVAQEFFAGKTITIVVASGAGGGHDIFARMLSRYWPKYLPGNPQMIIQNMPGAGGARAAEYVATVAPKDGTVVSHTFPGAILSPLLEDGVKHRYDPAKLAYIGSGDTDTRTCAVLKTNKIKKLEDLKTTPTAFGASAPGGSTHDYARMLATLMGAQVKVVNGYTGTPPITLGMERGELDGVCGWGWSIFKSEKPDWKTNNPFNFLVQFSLQPDPELVELGVPDFSSFLTGLQQKAAALVISQQAFSRPYITAPEVSSERLDALRDGFSKALADPALVAEFAKINIVNRPVSGKAMQKLVADIYASPDDVVQEARRAIRPVGK